MSCDGGDVAGLKYTGSLPTGTGCCYFPVGIAQRGLGLLESRPALQIFTKKKKKNLWGMENCLGGSPRMALRTLLEWGSEQVGERSREGKSCVDRDG